MEAGLSGERHAELGEAGLDAVVAAVQLVVAVKAPVHDPGERRGSREADGVPAAAKGHGVRVRHVLAHALGARPDVVHLPVVVPVEHGRQVLREEHRVIVAHDQPPRLAAASASASALLRPRGRSGGLVIVGLGHRLRHPRRGCVLPTEPCRVRPQHAVGWP